MRIFTNKQMEIIKKAFRLSKPRDEVTEEDKQIILDAVDLIFKKTRAAR